MANDVKKSEILFCFDTEDFTSNYSADAIKYSAQILESEGIKGNYMMVGLLAQNLIKWRRFDVLDALKSHCIQFHSYGHSLHPTLVEYTDIADFDEAYMKLIKEESQGLGMVKAATGVDRVNGAVPPGESYSYVAMYAYADMGIPLYCGSLFSNKDGTDVYFCNQLHIEYYQALEWMFFQPDYDVHDMIEKLAARKRTIIYHHPNMALHSTFWDMENYYRGNHAEYGNWKEAKRLAPEDVALFYSRFRELIRELKADGRFRFTNADEIGSNELSKPARIIDSGNINDIREALNSDFQSGKYSIAEVYSAVTALLKGEKSYTCGKVYGFLETPKGVDTACEVSAEGLREAARKLNTGYFAPASITVDGIEIGPADYLMAGLDVLCSGGERVIIEPKEQLNNIDMYPLLKHISLKNAWVFSKDFEDNYITDRLRLQSWTLRRPED